MRLHLKVKAKGITIPFDHQPRLVGTIHKWLGKGNNMHGSLSLYSFSRLENAKNTKVGLYFEKDSSFFFSSYDSSLIKIILNGIMKDPILFNELIVKEAIIQEDPGFDNIEFFKVASPILIKSRNELKTDHLIYSNPKANEIMEKVLIKKMELAGIQKPWFNIEFITNYYNAGTKMINYNNIQNRTNWCPVTIKGPNEVKVFAWNVGLGHSTGIGFGAIR